MKRDDVVKAVLELPETANVTVARLGPNDVVVVEHPGCISNNIADRLTRHLKQLWPNNEVVVLGEGMTLKIAREAPQP